MYKLFKWVYGLGIRHERRRVRLLIAQYRNKKPEQQDYALGDEKENRRRFKEDLALWHAVEFELSGLLEPRIPVQVDYTAPIDLDEEVRS